MTRYKAGQREETRQKILKAASRGFRSRGYAGIGIDRLSKGAGVTSGAFYTHFGSKDKAFAEVLLLGLDEVIQGIPRFQEKDGERWVESFVDYYLSQDHQNDLECGCAMATLTPEVIRGSPSNKEAYERKMLKIVTLCAQGLKGGKHDDKIARAWGLLSILIGGLSMIRALHTEQTKAIAAKSFRTLALEAAGPVKMRP